MLLKVEPGKEDTSNTDRIIVHPGMRTQVSQETPNLATCNTLGACRYNPQMLGHNNLHLAS